MGWPLQSLGIILFLKLRCCALQSKLTQDMIPEETWEVSKLILKLKKLRCRGARKSISRPGSFPASVALVSSRLYLGADDLNLGNEHLLNMHHVPEQCSAFISAERECVLWTEHYLNNSSVSWLVAVFHRQAPRLWGIGVGLGSHLSSGCSVRVPPGHVCITRYSFHPCHSPVT